jgi:hypothetical protein
MRKIYRICCACLQIAGLELDIEWIAGIGTRVIRIIREECVDKLCDVPIDPIPGMHLRVPLDFI